MNPFLFVLIGSTLAGMVLWGMHIDRRRSERRQNKESKTMSSAYRRWAEREQDGQQAGLR